MIDKSIRQHYDNKYSAKNRKGLDEGGWGGDESWGEPSDNGGNDDGGWSPSVSYSPPPPRSTPSPHVDTAADLMAEATRMEAERKAIEAEIEAEQHEAERSNQLAEARRLMTQRTDVQMPDVRTPISLGQIDPYQQSYILPNEILTDPWSTYDVQKEKKEIEDARRIDVGFQEALRKQKIATDLRQKQQDPDYGQFFRQPTMVETPKSGIMGTVKDKSIQMAKDFATRKAMKALGLTALNPVLGIGSWLLDKFAPGKKAALKSNITNLLTRKSDDLVGTSDWQGEKKRTFHEGKGDGPKPIAEQVTQGTGLAEGQKMLGLDDKQIQQIYQGRDLLNKTIEAGVYQGKQLTADQIKLLQNKQMELNKLIQAIEKAQAPVPLAYGGRIDKALGGRSRDI